MIELNKFYVGESVNFMKNNIPDNFIDLTITSPPYDDLRKYKGFIFDYESVIKELYRTTKDGGIVIWVVGDKTDKGSETLTSFKQALYAKEIGFNIHDTMIYAKNNPVPLNHNRYEQQFEYMFVFSKGKPKTFNPLMEDCKYAGLKRNEKNRQYRKDSSGDFKTGNISPTKDKKLKYNIWFYKVGSGQSSKDKIAFKHPAVFPEQLALDHILSWSNEGDLVMDCMCGSGTVPKMAYLNNRNFIGIDMSKEYINDICIPRLKDYGWSENNTYINSAI